MWVNPHNRVGKGMDQANGSINIMQNSVFEESLIRIITNVDVKFLLTVTDTVDQMDPFSEI